jgi:putative DNA primase/helicase
VCAADIKPKRIGWFWPNRFARGKVGVLGGHPDEGKSLILADMIARASRGDSWPCNEGRAPIGNVVFLTAEDDLDDTMIPRLIAAGADRKRVYFMQMVKKTGGGSRTFSLLTDLELLERKVVEIGDVVFVGIDPLSAYSYCVTNFGVCCEQRSMGNARASLRERPPISVASLQSSSERGVQAATADPLGW